MLDIIHAQSPHHIQQVKDLIAEFSAWDKGVTASLGYDLAQLDYQYLETVTFMKSAHALYHAAGFRDIPPYYEIPSAFAPITMFMALELPTHA